MADFLDLKIETGSGILGMGMEDSHTLVEITILSC